MEERERQSMLRARRLAARKKRKRKILLKKIIAVLILAVVTFLLAFVLYKGGSFVYYKLSQHGDGSFEKKPKLSKLEQVKFDAENLSIQYDYDGAIKTIESYKGYEKNKGLIKLHNKYQGIKSSCTAYPADEVEHVFFHSLVVDPKAAFEQGDSLDDGWKMWMTTVDEFESIITEMYQRGYVLVSLHDLVNETENEDGTVSFKPNESILLPPGKKAFVLSLDDTCYYHAYEGRGTAMKLVLDENGNVMNEYTQPDGKTVIGAYDCIPILNEFVKEHPDFSYKGAMGTIALTGYNGVFGYRTDICYKTKKDLDDVQSQWLDEHPDFDYDKECDEAKKVADKIKEDGWEIASHTWGHITIGSISLDGLKNDTKRWADYVAPIVGKTDTIIFAHGQDINGDRTYSDADEKFVYLKSQGYNYYCNVDASFPYVYSIGDDYLRMGRIDLDGYRIWQCANEGETRLDNLFDSSAVIDPARTDMPEP